MPVRKIQATLGLVILIFWIGQDHNLCIRIGKPHYKEFNLAKIGAVQSCIKTDYNINTGIDLIRMH